MLPRPVWTQHQSSVIALFWWSSHVFSGCRNLVFHLFPLCSSSDGSSLKDLVWTALVWLFCVQSSGFETESLLSGLSLNKTQHQQSCHLLKVDWNNYKWISWPLPSNFFQPNMVNVTSTQVLQRCWTQKKEKSSHIGGNVSGKAEGLVFLNSNSIQ